MSETIGTALPAEMTRVRDVLIPMYQSIGPAGSFALMMMRRSLDEAARVMAEGDTVGMIRALEDLRGYKS